MTNVKHSYRILVRTRDGNSYKESLMVVDGYVYNDLGIHNIPGQKRWIATHLPSGRKICTAPTRRECYSTARDIIGKIDNAIIRRANEHFKTLIKEEKERIQNDKIK